MCRSIYLIFHFSFPCSDDDDAEALTRRRQQQQQHQLQQQQQQPATNVRSSPVIGQPLGESTVSWGEDASTSTGRGARWR